MQLKVRRSQRIGGVMGTTAIFAIEARAEFTSQELSEISKYKLGKLVVYNSKAHQKHADAVQSSKGMAPDHPGLMALSAGKTMFHAVAARMSLVMTIDSLQRGQRIECKDLDEVLEAEDALDVACRAVRRYLKMAATFDGRDILADYTTEEPTITVGQAPASGSLPPLTTETYTPPEITDESSAPQSATLRQQPQLDAKFDNPSEAPPPFERLVYWFNSLTSAQKTGVVIGCLLIVIIFAQAL